MPRESEGGGADSLAGWGPAAAVGSAGGALGGSGSGWLCEEGGGHGDSATEMLLSRAV